MPLYELTYESEFSYRLIPLGKGYTRKEVINFIQKLSEEPYSIKIIEMVLNFGHGVWFGMGNYDYFFREYSE